MLISLLAVYGFWVYSQNLNEGKPWTFAVIGDTRSGGKYSNTGVNDVVTRAIAEAIVKDDCDFVLVPGDMIHGYSKDNNLSAEKQFEYWKTSMSPVYSAGIEVYTIRGNHESGSEDAYVQAFGADNPDNGPPNEKDLTYSFTHKNVFFMGIDEYVDPHIHKVNQEWVDSQLEDKSQQHIFIFGHEPAFKVNHKDCLEVYPKARDEFWNSIGDAGCQVYFCGHDHFYNRACISDNSGNEIHQIIVGSGGAPCSHWDPSKGKENSRFKLKFHDQVDYGYSLVTVDGDMVNIEWKAWNGSSDSTWVTKDSFQLDKKVAVAAT